MERHTPNHDQADGENDWCSFLWISSPHLRSSIFWEGCSLERECSGAEIEFTFKFILSRTWGQMVKEGGGGQSRDKLWVKCSGISVFCWYWAWRIDLNWQPSAATHWPQTWKSPCPLSSGKQRLAGPGMRCGSPHIWQSGDLSHWSKTQRLKN